MYAMNILTHENGHTNININPIDEINTASITARFVESFDLDDPLLALYISDNIATEESDKLIAEFIRSIHYPISTYVDIDRIVNILGDCQIYVWGSGGYIKQITFLDGKVNIWNSSTLVTATHHLTTGCHVEMIQTLRHLTNKLDSHITISSEELNSRLRK